MKIRALSADLYKKGGLRRASQNKCSSSAVAPVKPSNIEEQLSLARNRWVESRQSQLKSRRIPAHIFQSRWETGVRFAL